MNALTGRLARGTMDLHTAGEPVRHGAKAV